MVLAFNSNPPYQQGSRVNKTIKSKEQIFNGAYFQFKSPLSDGI